MIGDKLRFRFSKVGPLRLLSHHDMMRCLERVLRRADVPFKSTAGFHPTPRFVFALSLPLGVAGRREVIELELTQPRESGEILAQLNAQSPAGLSFDTVAVVPMRATALPRRAVYCLPIPEDRAVETEIAELLANTKIWVDRLKPSPKRLNIRPYIREMRIETAPLRSEPTLILDFWVTQTGTAKADELIRLLGLTDIVEAGAVLERAELEIRDETPNTTSADSPPDGPAESLPLDAAAIAALTREANANQPADASWGLSPNGPVVE